MGEQNCPGQFTCQVVTMHGHLIVWFIIVCCLRENFQPCFKGILLVESANAASEKSQLFSEFRALCPTESF